MNLFERIPFQSWLFNRLDKMLQGRLSGPEADNLLQVVSGSCHLPPKIDFAVSLNDDSHTFIAFDIAENCFDDGLTTPIYMHFDHERMDVYQSSLKFLVMSAGIIKAFPPGWPHLADQMHRAAVSITLNIAEGAGEFSKGDKAPFYRMAKR